MSPYFFPAVETENNYTSSFMCDLFGCKDVMHKENENNGYWECTRCNNREYFSTFKWTIKL